MIPFLQYFTQHSSKRPPQPPYSFETIDCALENCGFSKEQKMLIYKLIASILFLRNINFEDLNNEDGCKISSEAENSLANAAYLLGIDAIKLKKVFIGRSMHVAGSEIRFIEQFELVKIMSYKASRKEIQVITPFKLLNDYISHSMYLQNSLERMQCMTESINLSKNIIMF